MKNMIKLGLVSTLLSATLLADVNVNSSAEVISATQTDIHLFLRDTETGEPISEGVDFSKLSVDAGAKIDGVEVRSSGSYAFHILPTAGCNKSANPEVKGVFSTTIRGKKVEVPYSLCKERRDLFETAHPYKNNVKQEKVLFAKVEDNAIGDFHGYAISIEGETEKKYDTITFTDMSGKVLEAEVYDTVTGDRKVQKLEFSGKVDKMIFLDGPESGLEVKVIFASDSSVTKEGVKVYMNASLIIAGGLLIDEPA